MRLWEILEHCKTAMMQTAVMQRAPACFCPKKKQKVAGKKKKRFIFQSFSSRETSLWV